VLLSVALAAASCKNTAGQAKGPLFSASGEHILPESRTVELVCDVAISGIGEKTKEVRAWVPFPAASRYQRVIEPALESPSSYRPVIHYDTRYDTPMMYLSAEGPLLPKELNVRYSVRVQRGRMERQEMKIGPVEPDNVIQGLFATDLAVGSGVSELELTTLAARVAPSDNSPLVRARKIYEYVVNTLELDNAVHFTPNVGDNTTTAPGAMTDNTTAVGNVTTGAVTTGYGATSDNTTLAPTARHVLDVLATKRAGPVDYATVTVMLMRAAGIPARVESGLLLREDKTPDRTPVSECATWVRFFVNGFGWSACDPYLAKRFPELREQTFGGLSANRLQMSAGPEPALTPTPQGGLPVLFLAPIAEADGKPVPVSMRLSFRDVPGGK